MPLGTAQRLSVRLGGLQVDDEVEPSGLLTRKVRDVGALEYLVRKSGRSAPQIKISRLEGMDRVATRNGALANRSLVERETARRVALVVRVSTTRQADNDEGSLKNQLQRLRAHLEYKTTACGEDWSEVAVY